MPQDPPPLRLLAGSPDSATLPDTKAFLRRLSLLPHTHAPPSPLLSQEEWDASRGLFDWASPVVVARAPGRMDVMGGIADYSGSLVLQMPIKDACHVALQRLPFSRIPLSSPPWSSPSKSPSSLLSAGGGEGGGEGGVIRIVSYGAGSNGRTSHVELPLAPLLGSSSSSSSSSSGPSPPMSYEEARAFFEAKGLKWAAYVAGTLLVLAREKAAEGAAARLRQVGGGGGGGGGDGGGEEVGLLSILVSSDVPEGKGVSSSAALEVATMVALCSSIGLPIHPEELALLCQKVENRVVGAPCGIMDQMAVAVGRKDMLLALLCQPATVRAHVSIPPGVRFWGVDSGVRHSVGGSDYSAVRTAAFMGRSIIRSLSLSLSQVDAPEGSRPIPASKAASVDYLCNISPHTFVSKYQQWLPERIEGGKFKAEHGDHGDEATEVDGDTIYAPRAAASHPIHEHFRVNIFGHLLRSLGFQGGVRVGESDEQKREDASQKLDALGELMIQSHVSYSSCGLGSTGTDRLVELVEEEKGKNSAMSALYGAKITGGGSGGTVCILGSGADLGEAAVRAAVERYSLETGVQPYIFEGSSPGAAQFGYLELIWA